MEIFNEYSQVLHSLPPKPGWEAGRACEKGPDSPDFDTKKL